MPHISTVINKVKQQASPLAKSLYSKYSSLEIDGKKYGMYQVIGLTGDKKEPLPITSKTLEGLIDASKRYYGE